MIDIERIYNEIPGYTGKYQLALIDIMCNYINPEATLEIGSFKGRTGALLAAHAPKGHQFIEPDKQNCLDSVNNIRKFTNNPITYNNTISYYITNELPQKHFDLIHIDGSHTRQYVLYDLDMAKKALKHSGVIMMDDFYSLEYPQITQAVYEWLVKNQDMVLFFTGFFKGFICYLDQYKHYVDKILMHMLADIKNYNCSDDVYKIGNYCICKSDSIADCFTYTLMKNTRSNHPFMGNDMQYDKTFEKIINVPVDVNLPNK